MRLAKSTAWNLFGLGSPIVLALLCVPVLIHNLGNEKFGFVGMLWALLGTAALFDLGLGRVMTVLISRKLAEGNTASVAIVVRSGLVVLSGIGVCFALLVALCSGLIVSYIKDTSVPFAELRESLLVASPAILLVVFNSGVNATLEAFRRFDRSNTVRLLVGLGTIGGTTAVSFTTSSLPHLAAVLWMSRLLSVSVGAWFLAREMECCPKARAIRKGDLIEIFRFGGWITAGNLLSPLLAYSDRFALSALVPAHSFAYYLVPYDVLTRTMILPGAFVSSVLPEFSRHPHAPEARSALRYGATRIAAVMLVVVGLLGAGAHFGLSLWISKAFADESFRTAQMLCVGLLCNSVATLPFVYLQARGDAKRLVRVLLCEVPFYILALYVCGSGWGPFGIAFAWSLRMLVDAALLWGMVLQSKPQSISTPSE